MKGHSFFDLYINKILKLSVSTFQNATNSVLYIHNATLLYVCVLKMISSGSLISVNPRLAVVCKSGICIFLWGIGIAVNFQSAVGGAAESRSDFGDGIAEPSFAWPRRRDPPPAETQWQQKSSPAKRRDCLILLSS